MAALRDGKPLPQAAAAPAAAAAPGGATPSRARAGTPASAPPTPGGAGAAPGLGAMLKELAAKAALDTQAMAKAIQQKVCGSWHHPEPPAAVERGCPSRPPRGRHWCLGWHTLPRGMGPAHSATPAYARRRRTTRWSCRG
jgi:hypothetical protein